MAKTELAEEYSWRRKGVGEPGGCHREGHVAPEAHGENGCGQRLERHRHHGKEQAEGQAYRDRVATGDPKAAVEKRPGKRHPPLAVAQSWVSQGPECPADKFEIALFHARAYART